LRARFGAHLAAFTIRASNAIDAVLLHEVGKRIRVEGFHTIHVVGASSVGPADAARCAIMTLAAAWENIPLTLFIFLVVDTCDTRSLLVLIAWARRYKRFWSTAGRIALDSKTNRKLRNES
jgi:hypothetical protein